MSKSDYASTEQPPAHLTCARLRGHRSEDSSQGGDSLSLPEQENLGSGLSLALHKDVGPQASRLFEAQSKRDPVEASFSEATAVCSAEDALPGTVICIQLPVLLFLSLQAAGEQKVIITIPVWKLHRPPSPR